MLVTTRKRLYIGDLNIISNFEFPISDLTFPIVTEKEFGSREVGKKSEFPTFRFSIVTGLTNVESRLFKTLHSFFEEKAVSAQRYSVFFKN